MIPSDAFVEVIRLFLEGIWAIGQLSVSPKPLEALPDADRRGDLLLDFLKFGVFGVVLLNPATRTVLLSLADQVIHGCTRDIAYYTVPESVKAWHDSSQRGGAYLGHLLKVLQNQDLMTLS